LLIIAADKGLEDLPPPNHSFMSLSRFVLADNILTSFPKSG
jgi:hypothetical protein